jgi:hypothetical protein
MLPVRRQTNKNHNVKFLIIQNLKKKQNKTYTSQNNKDQI